jgi:hypothetical protein
VRATFLHKIFDDSEYLLYSERSQNVRATKTHILSRFLMITLSNSDDQKALSAMEKNLPSPVGTCAKCLLQSGKNIVALS